MISTNVRNVKRPLCRPQGSQLVFVIVFVFVLVFVIVFVVVFVNVKRPLCRLQGSQLCHNQCPSWQFQAAPGWFKGRIRLSALMTIDTTVSCLIPAECSSTVALSLMKTLTRRMIALIADTTVTRTSMHIDNIAHSGLRRLVAEERSTTVALAGVLPSLGETSTDHWVRHGVHPGRWVHVKILTFTEIRWGW